jgi:hypothetical protein
MLVAIIGISGASAACCYILNLGKVNSLFFSVLFISLPQFAYQLQFSNQDETFGLAILLAACSGIFALQNRKSSLVIFVLLNVIVLSIYQSLIFFSATLITLKLLNDSCHDKCTYKKWFFTSSKVALGLITSVIIYLIITTKIKHLFGVSSSSYFTDLITWHELGFANGIKNTFSFIYDRTGPYPLYGLATYSFSYFAAAVILLINITKRKAILPLIIVTLTLSLLMPFALNLMIGGGTPGRTLSQLSLVFAGLVTICISNFKCKSVKYLSAIFFLIVGCTSTSQLFYSDYISEKQNELLARRITSDIYSKYPSFDGAINRVLFIGKANVINRWKKFNSDDFGVSFFERGDSGRIINYINISGIDTLKNMPINNFNKVSKEEINKMPSWPNQGSIQMLESNIVVKLSEI